MEGVAYSRNYGIIVRHSQIKVNDQTQLQDIASLVGVADECCTVEPFVDAKYDVHIQKIGPHYKAFV